MMMSPVARPRQRKVKHNIVEKINVDFYRYLICLSVLALTLATLFLSWGAMELEDAQFSAYANRTYDELPKSGTDITCFYTRSGYEHRELCEKMLSDQIHRAVVYYGVRIDCIMSSPLLLISFWFFWYESFGHYMLWAAHFCAWTKSISITAVLTCVLIDDPSYMREIFEKSQFGFYESKLLYSFTMVFLSSFFNVLLVICLVMAYFLPKPTASKYRVGPPQPAGDMHRFEYSNAIDNVRQFVAKSRNAGRVSVVQAIPIEDIVFKTPKSNPV
ncbi:hypothetical protein CAEBREN_11072 [Caenorhabditis brenneri]|uniref:Uncharacterized protein n=1 Tax=Caenorhabditis brenneri TaxID=135651 RepID=G0NKZ2_CAEBE|nr:hypothetical protein CAEBREN_11072 [Caenorhabditis brenneri]